MTVATADVGWSGEAEARSTLYWRKRADSLTWRWIERCGRGNARRWRHAQKCTQCAADAVVRTREVMPGPHRRARRQALLSGGGRAQGHDCWRRHSIVTCVRSTGMRTSVNAALCTVVPCQRDPLPSRRARTELGVDCIWSRASHHARTAFECVRPAHSGTPLFSLVHPRVEQNHLFQRRIWSTASTAPPLHPRAPWRRFTELPFLRRSPSYSWFASSLPTACCTTRLSEAWLMATSTARCRDSTNRQPLTTLRTSPLGPSRRRWELACIPRWRQRGAGGGLCMSLWKGTFDFVPVSAGTCCGDASIYAEVSTTTAGRYSKPTVKAKSFRSMWPSLLTTMASSCSTCATWGSAVAKSERSVSGEVTVIYCAAHGTVAVNRVGIGAVRR